MSQLTQYTSLNRRQLPSGIIVLLQNNLLCYQVESGHALYTANPDAAYNLIRTGKILDMVGNVYGEAEKEVMQNLLSMGHTQVEHLREAYQAKFQLAARIATTSNGGTNGHVAQGEEDSFDTNQQDRKTGLYIKTLEELDDALARVVEAELVVEVTQSSFRSWEDTRKLIEDEVRDTYFAGGVRGAKGKEEFASKLSKRLREVREEPLSLKRKVHAKNQMNKRRKVSERSSVHTGFGSDSGLLVDVGDLWLECART